MENVLTAAELKRRGIAATINADLAVERDG
jgi:hypothetical protein